MASNFNGIDRLAIAEISFFSITLGGSIHLLIRHGFRRQFSWYLLACFNVLRIVGAVIRLQSPDLTAFADPVGGALLLLTLLEILYDMNEDLPDAESTWYLLFGTYITCVGALLLAMLGFLSAAESGTIAEIGEHFIQAAAILSMVICLVIVYIAIRMHQRPGPGHLWACTISGLLLIVRMYFDIFAAFAPPGTGLSYHDNDVHVRIITQLGFESVAVALFIATGLLMPKVQSVDMGARTASNDVEKQQIER